MSWIIFWRQSYLFPWGKIRDYLFGKHLIFCIGLLAIFSGVTYFVSVKWDLVHSVICSFGFTWFLSPWWFYLLIIIIDKIFYHYLHFWFSMILFLHFDFLFAQIIHIWDHWCKHRYFSFKHLLFDQCWTGVSPISQVWTKDKKYLFFVSCRIDFNSSIFGNDAILAALLICCVKGEEKWIWRCVDWCCLLYWWRCGRVTLSEAHISFFVGGRAPSQKK